MSRKQWRNSCVACIVTLCLFWQSASPVFAQTTSESPILDSKDPLLEDGPVEPYVPKPDSEVTDVISPDDEKKLQQSSYNLYIPHMVTNSGNEPTVQAAATPYWRLILSQTFEGDFPPANTNWAIRDHNGPNVGVKLHQYATLVWDDNSTRAYKGTWSANPNDGAWAADPAKPNEKTYANLTDTWMRYGPLNLVGATDAVLNSWYWLDTETYYDFYSIEYSCKNNGNWHSATYSGNSNGWVPNSISLSRCLGQSNVYIRFFFRSEYSNPSNPAPDGVWVDQIEVWVYK